MELCESPEGLTPELRWLKHRQKTSIWNAFIKRIAGTKQFVMSIWQLGVPWAPTVEMLNADRTGAIEHVANHFAQWTIQLARSVKYHKMHEKTEEARRRKYWNLKGRMKMADSSMAHRLSEIIAHALIGHTIAEF